MFIEENMNDLNIESLKEQNNSIGGWQKGRKQGEHPYS